MDSAQTQAAGDRVYEDFEPYHEWSRDEARFTVMLPGYKRDQLKVQMNSKPALKLMGERFITGNRWRRFSLEFPIPSDYDTDNVTATFEGNRLSIKFGKLIKPKETATTPPEEEAPRPQEPSPKVDEQKPAQEDTPKGKEAKEEARTNQVSDQKTPQETARDKEAERSNEVSDQKIPQKEVKESTDEMEKNKTERAAASMERVTEEARTNGLTETTEAAISKAPKTKPAKSVKRSITKFIDFTLNFEPSNQVGNEGLGGSAAGFNDWKKLVKWGMLIFLVVGLGLYTRNAFRSSHGERNFQEL